MDDAELKERYDELRQAYALSLRRERELVETAIPVISEHLTERQRQIWECARSRRGFDFYQYVPNLTREQYTALLKAQRTKSAKLNSRLSAEESRAIEDNYKETVAGILSADQKTALAEVCENSKNCMKGVLNASDAVLPVPEELEVKLPLTSPEPPPEREKAASEAE